MPRAQRSSHRRSPTRSAGDSRTETRFKAPAEASASPHRPPASGDSVAKGRHPTRPPTPRYVAFAQAIAPLVPDELPDVDEGEFADAQQVTRGDTSKGEHMRAGSEHVLDAAPPGPTTSHHDHEFADPRNSGKTGDVSPRAWLSQRSRRGVSLADKAF